MRLADGQTKLDNYRYESLFVIVTMLRLLLLVKYLLIITDVRIIVYVSQKLATSFLGILFMFYLITFEFQTIGQICFGGVLNYANYPNELAVVGANPYISINFNDWFGGMMVLIAFVVSNNWNDITDEYIDANGHSFGTKFYFTLYFFLVVLIMLNIIISFVMEVYDSLDDIVIREMRKEKMLIKLSEAMP